MLRFQKTYISRLLFLLLFLTGSVVGSSHYDTTTFSSHAFTHRNAYVAEMDADGNHNNIMFVAVPVVAPVAVGITVATAAKVAAGIGFLGGCIYSILYAKSEAKNKTNTRTHGGSPNNPCWCGCLCGVGCACECYCPCGRQNRELQEKTQKNPHGIYEDAEYHHNNSTGNGKVGKSAAPKNGQAALNNSIKIPGNGKGRIGVSEGEIVVLSQTQTGAFHGHVISFKYFMSKYEAMFKELKDAGLLDSKGRPLK